MGGLEVKICKEKRKVVDESSCLRFEIECGQEKIMDPLCQKECDLKEESYQHYLSLQREVERGLVDTELSIKNIKGFKQDLMYILKQERIIEEISMKIPLRSKILLPEM